MPVEIDGLLLYIEAVPGVIALIFKSAFGMESAFSNPAYLGFVPDTPTQLRIIGVGTASILLGATYLLLRNLGMEGVPLLSTSFYFGFLILFFSMSVQLARNFTAVHRDRTDGDANNFLQR